MQGEAMFGHDSRRFATAAQFLRAEAAKALPFACLRGRVGMRTETVGLFRASAALHGCTNSVADATLVGPWITHALAREIVARLRFVCSGIGNSPISAPRFSA
jgi:hypothetical protein